MSWDIRDIRNKFPMTKSKMGQCLVTSTTPETDGNQLTLIVFEMQNLPGIEEADPEDEFFKLI